ncbi:M48 family metalloprotease [Sphingomonas bacterium]|uniref:M48 family metalloprotease n=1 Tax=Sphingomonas bacterium TaxID=1895847 RepID=UPI001575DD42|nr:M48 family metalloprotease [Sphingomonas bacterium]
MKRFAAACAAALLLWVQPAVAQSILRDAETESLFADMSAPLVKAAGLGPRNVQIVLIQDDSINAFTAGGQTVYLNSGLLQSADNANQVQGVIAHELGHVADGHVALADAGARPAMGMYILSMVLGVAAMAAGSAEAGAGIMAAGQQAATGKYLAFSRNVESVADATGAKFLRQGDISGRGMLAFFKKLQNDQYRYGYGNKDINPFLQTHPLSSERIATLTADLQASPAWNNRPDAALDERFRRVKAKLAGYVLPVNETLAAYPPSDQSVYAHYARAYAYHKGGYPEKAQAEAEALVAARPRDPYFQEVQGQIMLEAGHPREALTPLRAAVQGSNNNPLIATTLGHALVATDDKANLVEAVKVLRSAVARDDDNPFAWFQLGAAYEAQGDQARAALASAEQQGLIGDSRRAAVSARHAMAGIAANTPDWIRAQDIAMTAQNAWDVDPRNKHRRK